MTFDIRHSLVIRHSTFVIVASSLTALLLAVVIGLWNGAAFAAPAGTTVNSGIDDSTMDGTEGIPELEAKIDLATDGALAYLASIQQPNGSWAQRNGKTWVPSPFSTASGSLAIMAFLSKGHQSGQEQYGSVIDNGLDFILAQQLPNGSFAGRGGQMYAHGITTLMLSEAVGQTIGKRNQQIKAALAKAAKLILDAQKVTKPDRFQGGWRYQPTAVDSDLSCTGWQLMALRAAKNAGAEVPTTAIDEAVAYVKRSAAKAGGFGYQPGANTTAALAGTGICCLELCGQHHAKESLAAGDWLLANSIRPYGGNYQYYTMYYCSQGMFQLGERYWTQFWPTFAEEVLKRQQPDGSFPPGTGQEATAGPAYGTSMAVLTLAVRYRLLPIYQR